MGDLYLADLADVCRQVGVPVIELDDWLYRARGSGGYEPGRPTHIMIHHTASPPSTDGWPDVNYCTFGDEDAPLANLYLSRVPEIYVCAGGATNTNGSGSDPCGIVPDDSMNSSAIGIEAANDGVGELWPDVMLDAYLELCRRLCAAYNIPARQIHSHWEWAPTRKYDPAGGPRWQHGGGPSPISWTMDEYRSDVELGGGSTEEDDVTDEDIDKIAERAAEKVWQYMIDMEAKGAPDRPAWWLLRQAKTNTD